jgi:uracil-DNA glycosylase family 4
MEVSGKGIRKILIVGEAPGKDEDNQNEQFVGVTGQYQEDSLEQLGINMRRDCWLTNSLICRPPGNATPTSEQISYCYPNLSKTIRELKPNVIITVGRAALESILTEIWEDEIGPMGRWVGWKIPCQKYNCWICPTYHPSFVLRELEYTKSKSPIREIYMSQLKAATRLRKKPYKKIPNYEGQIEVLYDQNKIAGILDTFVAYDWPISFDYETDTLKPDKDGQIITASVCCNGKRTIAFPWAGDRVKNAWIQLLTSKCKKIGFNSKFEDRWTRSKLGIEINNWVCDSMVDAHLLDCRRGICSLGFQAFVQLGFGNYYSQISPFLEQKSSYDFNNIKKADLNKLLVYNGLDSLLNFLIARKQRKQLGLEPL